MCRQGLGMEVFCFFFLSGKRGGGDGAAPLRERDLCNSEC